MRLFIADANSTNRLALQLYLHNEPGMYVTGMASEAQGLLAQVEASQPDVLLLDWQLAFGATQELLIEILDIEYPPKVVVLSANSSVESVALSTGAYAFIDKNAPPERLLEVLHLLKKNSVDSINS